MDTPALRIAPEAKEVLARMLAEEPPMAVSVQWNGGELIRRALNGRPGPGWLVTFVETGTVDYGWMSEIDGLPFHFEHHESVKHLDGAVIEWVGHFEVVESPQNRSPELSAKSGVWTAVGPVDDDGQVQSN